jgi:hypothetical protein
LILATTYQCICSYYDMFSTEMKHFNYTFILNIEIFVTHTAQFCVQESLHYM